MIVPQQSNAVDCGFYECIFLKSLALGLQFSGTLGTDNNGNIGQTIQQIGGLELANNSIRIPGVEGVLGLNMKYIAVI